MRHLQVPSMRLSCCEDASSTEVLSVQVREKHRALLAQHHERFHPVWGQLLKTGYQNSRFAHQVC